MNIIAVGGDLRFAYLAKLARERGLNASAICLENANVPGVLRADPEALSHAEVLVLPNPFARGLQTPYSYIDLTLKELLQKISAGTTLAVFGDAPAPEELEKKFRILYLNDEELMRKLAWQTAEGAIFEVGARLNRTLRDCAVLVLGYGRIGQALTDILVGYGARVTVAARRPEMRRLAKAAGALRAVDFAALPELLPAQAVIFSTPPERVLDRMLLETVEKSALLVDLSGSPYGVDMKAAEQLSLNAWLSPGIPGRFCPESAGEALLDALWTALKEER